MVVSNEYDIRAFYKPQDPNALRNALATHLSVPKKIENPPAIKTLLCTKTTDAAWGLMVSILFFKSMHKG